ncbi:hypothetical protein K3172_13060 [Qipengyuania sp. 6B39]|uniref:XRE family transcriptional regulator n=1 Tax=Qipengyuania proteolytica TaxID=2867239 RepID=UPI001C899901|nr:XRE family transcriptional regulator [Qipengyuania proteolytica]MBX7496789.1 hypothetical protein [Qipengyuania proteolytica]
MPKPAEILIERIDERLSDLGKTRYWLSKEVTDGSGTTVIRDIDRRKSMPAADRLERIAEALDTTTDWLLGSSTNPAPVRSEVTVSDKRIDWRGPPMAEPGIPLVGTGDCATIALEDATGRMVEIERSSFDPDYHQRMLARPPALRGARDLYAIYFHGESMEPRFEAGEIGIVDPQRPVRAGDYVLVQLNGGDSDEVVSVLVKRLVRQNAQEILLEQFNPPVTFAVPKSRVSRVHRILQQTDLLFG